MLKVFEIAMLTNFPIIKPLFTPNPFPYTSLSTNPRTPLKPHRVLASWKAPVSSTSGGAFYQTFGGQVLSEDGIPEYRGRKSPEKKRVFLLDVNPLCYDGSTPSLNSFAHWVSLFFSQVSLSDPVIAVLDGEGGNERRRQLLPSYKAHRRKLLSQLSVSHKFPNDHVERHQIVKELLTKCNVPIVKIEGHEADDVVATLVGQVLERGYKVVVASPDKDFKQLISEDVQIVMPITELNRWSFYTLRHYTAQYNCDPSSDLSLRCILGDEVDGIDGIQNLAPGFGRKTALKLLKKHGSLENLLKAATIRTVGKPYAQDALVKYADHLRRNYEVLALRRDVDVRLQEEWLVGRDGRNDFIVLSNFKKLEERRNVKVTRQNRSSHGEAPLESMRNLLNIEDNIDMKRLMASVFGFSFGQISLLISAQAAHAVDGFKTNALYETGELFELGIQLSYLLLLLALLGVGTFFVIRQVLVRRELDLSAKELQEQVRSGDASATEYFELGAVMLRRKFYPAATKFLLQAIEKWDGDDQDLAQVYNALGVSYVRDGKLDKGIAQFETALKLQPGYVTAWNNLGDAYEKKKDLKSALKAFEEVLLFDPNNKVARPRRDALKDRVEMYKGVPVKSKDR